MEEAKGKQVEVEVAVERWSLNLVWVWSKVVGMVQVLHIQVYVRHVDSSVICFRLSSHRYPHIHEFPLDLASSYLLLTINKIKEKKVVDVFGCRT